MMQTFLPYDDFVTSVRALDYQRLGKQRGEAKTILSTLRVGGGWSHHPAVRMWRGYEAALEQYMSVCIREWVARGYQNSMPIVEERVCPMPPWFGDAAFHASHRSNLLRKNSAFYAQFGWVEPTDLPYVWPVS